MEAYKNVNNVENNYFAKKLLSKMLYCRKKRFLKQFSMNNFTTGFIQYHALIEISDSL